MNDGSELGVHGPAIPARRPVAATPAAPEGRSVGGRHRLEEAAGCFAALCAWAPPASERPVRLDGAAGCYHQQSRTLQSGRQELRFDQALAAASQARSGSWTVAAQGGPLYLTALGDGGVRVTRGLEWSSRQPVRGVSNAWISSKVMSKFAVDSEVRAYKIGVSTRDNGIVSLSGQVRSPREASKAITDALNVEGVNAVESYLTYSMR